MVHCSLCHPTGRRAIPLEIEGLGGKPLLPPGFLTTGHIIAWQIFAAILWFAVLFRNDIKWSPKFYLKKRKSVVSKNWYFPECTRASKRRKQVECWALWQIRTSSWLHGTDKILRADGRTEQKWGGGAVGHLWAHRDWAWTSLGKTTVPVLTWLSGPRGPREGELL